MKIFSKSCEGGRKKRGKGWERERERGREGVREKKKEMGSGTRTWKNREKKEGRKGRGMVERREKGLWREKVEEIEEGNVEHKK